jgi:hypothetical protein
VLHLHRSARLAGVLLATALVDGCANLTIMSHVPLSTMSRLSSLKLAEIEPAELRLAARLPDALEPRPRGVKVRIDVAGQKPVWVYRLSPNDVDRLTHLIDEAGGASGVSIAAGVEACRRKPYGSAALPTTTFLRTNAMGFFVSLRISICEASSSSKILRHACRLVREGMRRQR